MKYLIKELKRKKNVKNKSQMFDFSPVTEAQMVGGVYLWLCDVTFIISRIVPSLGNKLEGNLQKFCSSNADKEDFPSKSTHLESLCHLLHVI